MLLLTLAFANPAVVALSKKGMEAPVIAHGTMLPPSKDRVLVVLPLRAVYSLKPGKEEAIVTGRASDPSWFTFREDRYLTVAGQQVRLTEDMVAEKRPERAQVLLAFPSRLVREITAELPSVTPSGALPLPGAELEIPGVGAGKAVRSWQEGYLLTDHDCSVAGDPVLDGFGRMVAMTLPQPAGCVATLLPELRYPTVRADIEATLERWEVPVSDWPTVMPAMLAGLPPALVESTWPTPAAPEHDSLLYRKAVEAVGREEEPLEEDQAKAWRKAREKGHKRHDHPAWY